MLSLIHKRSKDIFRLLAIFLLLVIAQPVWAGGPPAPSIFSNPLAVIFIILMLVLLIIIGILAYILVGTADMKQRKSRKSNSIPVAGLILLFLLLGSSSLFAQAGDTANQTASAPAGNIGGMSAFAFYVMASVIFLELLVIIVLLINIHFLLKVEKEKVTVPVVETAEVIAAKTNRLSWWDRFNKLRPVSQEADLDLGHDYDGIRELDNRLPPWWLYGFYTTIIIAVIYLWRFHVSHTGPSSREEYETSVATAELKVEQYLKEKGDNVDENTVTLLTSAADIDAGKAIFENPVNCVTCHRADGGGNVGPNLTDDYWLYGGGIKDLFKTIKYGTNKGMKSWKDDLSAKQIAQVASYVKSLRGTNPPGAKSPAGELYKEGAKTSVDSLKIPNDSIKMKDNKIVMNK